ncbi:hypothetical protein F511_02129 [Dorcoceras hygrometricum]|nr:hypothetical protein F511_02129 [Dorcoceras hygrometricum]
MRRVVNYHSSWARQQQVELFDASGNPGSTAGRGFNPAGGAPGALYTPPPSSQTRRRRPSCAAAAAAVRRRKTVSGQFDEENPFVLILSVLLVQPNEGVSDLVVDRIGVNYRNLPRRAGLLSGSAKSCLKPVPCISPASVSPWVSFSCDSSSESPAGRNSAAAQIQQQRKFSSDANSAVGHSAMQIQQLEFSDATFSSWTFGDANSAAGDLATQTSSSPRNYIIQISRHKSRFLMQETSPEKFRGNSHAYKPDFTL